MALQETAHSRLQIKAGEPVDARSIFLKEAASHRLLTRLEEDLLGRLVQRGLVAENMSKSQYDVSTNIQIARHIRQKKRAQKYLFDHNIRLLISVAKPFMMKCPLPLDDLIQEGSFGLFRAAGKYDPAKGSFAAFASPAIRNAIKRGIADTAYPIRIPEDELTLMKKVRRAQYSLMKQEEPTIEEVAEKVGVSPENTQRYIAQHKLHDEHTSLDVSKGGVMKYITTPASQHPELALEIKQRNQAILNALNHLTEKQREIIITRYKGQTDGEEITFEEVAKILGYKDKQSPHQSHNKSMGKLRKILKKEPQFA